jgi:hypothetical protein
MDEELASVYLPGKQARARWMRMDTARILKRFFFCEQALIVGQAGWLAAIAPLDVKLALPRFFWEDAMTANALRERVFELRFPSRLMEIGDDAPLVQLFEEAIHAPGAEAFIYALAHVFKPALLDAYRVYLAQADEIADGPTRRFLRVAVDEKAAQVTALSRMADEMLAANPARREEAEAWTAVLGDLLAQIGGVSVETPVLPGTPIQPPGRVPFKLAEIPARDARFHCCRFYWPDIIDPTFPYGEGLLLQLRSAVSHLNEVWAVETAGAILHAFAGTLGWEFVFDAARWTYDESRHCRMGYDRLLGWGFTPEEMPLGTYIYDSARGQEPLYRLGMLFYFETKNIGKKTQRAEAFARLDDQVSRHDMEFDWADETIHAHYGSYWLHALHSLRAHAIPEPDAVRSRCNDLVASVVASATDAERAESRQMAQRLIEKARQAGLKQ